MISSFVMALGQRQHAKWNLRARGQGWGHFFFTRDTRPILSRQTTHETTRHTTVDTLSVSRVSHGTQAIGAPRGGKTPNPTSRTATPPLPA